MVTEHLSGRSLAQLENSFFDVTKENASKWHDKHNSPGERWNYAEILTPDLVNEASRHLSAPYIEYDSSITDVSKYRALHEHAKAEHDQMVLLHHLFNTTPGVKEAFIIFLLTEDAITWYGRDVGRIFNPNSKDSSDPHAEFSLTWVSEEQQHGFALLRAAECLGLDLVFVENLRSKFIQSDSTPKFYNVFDGSGYTGLQEKNTNKPYQNLASALKGFFNQGVEKSSAAGKLLSAIVQTIGRIAGDERKHGEFITNCSHDALHYGSSKLAGATILGLADNYLGNFAMPGSKGIKNFRKLAFPIAKAGIYGPDEVYDSQRHLLNDVIKVGKVKGLVGQAALVQEQMVEKFDLAS